MIDPACSVKARIRALAVVEVQIPADRSARFADVGPQIDLLVFDRAPEPLNEDVVAPRAPAIHADRDGVVEERAGEVDAGELAWSVLKISGLPCFASTSSTASRQNSI